LGSKNRYYDSTQSKFVLLQQSPDGWLYISINGACGYDMCILHFGWNFQVVRVLYPKEMGCKPLTDKYHISCARVVGENTNNGGNVSAVYYCVVGGNGVALHGVEFKTKCLNSRM